MLNFIRKNIWSHLPRTFPPRHRYWAALLWGGGLLCYGLYLGWRREHAGLPRGLAPFVLTNLGAILAVLLPLPAPLGPRVYLWVLRTISIFGFFVSMLVLSAGFYLVVTPMGLLMRLAGRDPLRTGRQSPPAWVPHRGSPDRRRYFRQF